ncbi:MAG TPA: hypothetical protein VLY24_18945 [Bryobacteraceae bacterium]|nr:hypothetical protein [Bryobacteraceae bacterium]
MGSTSSDRIIEHESSAAGVWNPVTDAERAALRQQLERVLADPLFTHSRRYPNLLRYVVECSLSGRTDSLKERTLGVEVFGREPDYDTNVDPVVRTTAVEIRKRIAQYYGDASHADEIRIHLPAGSYVPEFRLAAAPAGDANNGAAALEIPPRRDAKRAVWVVGLVAAAIVLALWLRPWTPKTALDRFWSPVLGSSAPVLLCIGGPGDLANGAQPAQNADPFRPTPEMAAAQVMRTEHVTLSDVLTLSRVGALLRDKGGKYEIRGEANTTFSDLRNQPVVLIGAFNNDWTLRLTGEMRFTFGEQPEGDQRIFWIRDREHPSRKDWAVDAAIPYMKLEGDYALISRVLDPNTQRMVVVAAGLLQWGTVAAGEFLTDPRYLAQFAKQAPPGWERKNIQVVLSTQVIGGHSGPPRVLASSIW